MSQAQYDAIIEMSQNDGIRTPFETIKNQDSIQIMMRLLNLLFYSL